MVGRLNGQAQGALDASLDALARIILLARMFDASAVETGVALSSVDFPKPLANSAADLRLAIDRLSADDQAILVTLAWIGRGDFTAEEFDHALVLAFEQRAVSAAGYLLSLPMLGDLLERGSAACGTELSGISPGGPDSGRSLRHRIRLCRRNAAAPLCRTEVRPRTSWAQKPARKTPF